MTRSNFISHQLAGINEELDAVQGLLLRYQVKPPVIIILYKTQILLGSASAQGHEASFFLRNIQNKLAFHSETFYNFLSVLLYLLNVANIFFHLLGSWFHKSGCCGDDECFNIVARMSDGWVIGVQIVQLLLLLQ